MAWQTEIRGFEILTSLRDFAVKPTVLLSRMNKANFQSVLLALWDPDATRNVVNEFARVTCFRMKITRESFPVSGP